MISQDKEDPIGFFLVKNEPVNNEAYMNYLTQR